MQLSSKRFARAALLSLTGVLALACSGGEPVPIPDLDVAGPAPGFEMGSRLMTSSKRMEVRLTIPGKGTVKIPKFNGTFFYRQSHPEATTGTLLFRPDRFEDVDGTMSAALVREFDFDRHPFFAFQSRSAAVTDDGIDVNGKLIVKDRETDATLHLADPGRVAVEDDGEKWVEMNGTMEVDAAALGLTGLGDRLIFELDLFLRGYTAKSTESTGIDTAALDQSPPVLPGDAKALSDSAWYLMLNGRLDEAIDVFGMAIEKEPSKVNTYLRRGDAYLFNGDYGKAMGTYKTMAQFMPVHPHIFELTKVLDQEYLTPSTLGDANRKWTEAQSR